MINRTALLQVLNTLQDDVELQLETIAPFGFEVMDDTRFLDQDRISRIHLYSRAPAGRSVADAETKLSEWITQNCHLMSDVVGTPLSWVIGPGDPRRIGPPGGTMVHLKVFDAVTLPVTAPLLDAYSFYFALLPHLIASGQLYEYQKFALFPSSRRFVLQVSRTWPFLYPNAPWAGPSSCHLTAAGNQARRSPNTATRPEIPASAIEWEVLNKEVVPYAKNISASSTMGSGRRWKEILDFHSGDVVRTEVIGDAYIMAAERVRIAYRTFGVAVPAAKVDE